MNTWQSLKVSWPWTEIQNYLTQETDTIRLFHVFWTLGHYSIFTLAFEVTNIFENHVN